ncbi:MAG: hypothetical protein ACTHL8_25955 [Burkholderiaceae bacterium]
MPLVRPARALAVLLLALAAGGAAAAGAPARFGVVTLADGGGTLLRDDTRYAVAAGVALQAGDILATGPQAHVLVVETGDGLKLALGPGTRALVEPRLADEAPTVYLLSGWAKIGAPNGRAAVVDAPVVSVDAGGASIVVAPAADATVVFAEAGPLRVRRRASETVVPLQTGEMLSWNWDASRPKLSPRPSPGFVRDLPDALKVQLPSGYAAFKDKEAPPRALGAIAWADAQPWIDAEPVLREWAVRRWHALAKDPEFRRALVAGMKSHPEWEAALAASAPKRSRAASRGEGY